MNEYDLIRLLARGFPRSPKQKNDLFACDAEIIDIGGQLWGLTLDEFTPEEDLFTGDDPEWLGANLATATLSDLLAAGAEPQFFMHALAVPRQTDSAFLEGLCRGIRSVLEQACCFLCGGDVGTASSSWRYCGFAMGMIADNKPLTHVLDDQPQTLWVTGDLGDANVAALSGRPTPRFELRMDAARRIRQYGAACIDTSGGFLDAVWLLHRLRPELRLEIDIGLLPFAQAVLEFAGRADFPAEAALLGGAGEYELLFATPVDLPQTANAELASAAATSVGMARPHSEPGVYFLRHGEMVGAMKQAPPCPRAAPDIAHHIQDVLHAAREIFGCRPSNKLGV